MVIEIEHIKDFFGTQASHFDLQRLSAIFEHIPHYTIYKKRLKRLVENRHFGRREVLEILDLLDDLIALSTRSNLVKAKERLVGDIGGRLGAFLFHKGKLEFGEKVNQTLINQSITGNSVHAFFMTVLLKLDGRLRNDDEADDLHRSLTERLNRLIKLQKTKGENPQNPKSQTISEFIFANSSRIMVDLAKISKHSLDTDVKESISKHREDLNGLMGVEMKDLDERISEALIFLSQLQKLQKSSRAYAQKCRKSLEKMSRELLSIAYLVSCTEDVVKGQKIHDSQLVDNIRLNLFFALVLLPYHDFFQGRYQNALEDKLMYLSHLAQYLHSFDIAVIEAMVIPEDSEFVVEGLGCVKGKKVSEVFEELENHLDGKDQTVLWQFFMQIELYFRNKNPKDEEMASLMALKKVLAQKLLEQRSDKTIKTLYILKKLVSEDGDKKLADQLYISEDVVTMLRETCHSIEQLLNIRKSCIPKLYKKMDSPLLYFQKEKMPKSKYRRMTDGAITKSLAQSDPESNVGDQLEGLLSSLCKVCEGNIQRNAGSSLMDKVIREIAPTQGGLLDILDDPERLRQLMEVPLIKNQSLNKKRLVQLLQLTKTILSK